MTMRSQTKYVLPANGCVKLNPSLRRFLKRRSVIDPVIGHIKNDEKLGRNYLLGEEGNRINGPFRERGTQYPKAPKSFIVFSFLNGCLKIVFS